MKNQSLEQLKYPIGKAKIPTAITLQHIQEWLIILEEFPQKLTLLVSNLDDKQLATPYRPGGWTIRQVIHHLADSHLHSYIRFKWALTENKPTIKAYDEQQWAELHDAKNAPILLSLNALAATHAKLVYLLKDLSEIELEKAFIHPETGSEVALNKNIGIYAWHSQHHYAHIENRMILNGWK